MWATGNGGLTDDDCNCDGYTTSIYTISIGAISDHGLSTYYTETCASTLAVTFSGGSHRETVENRVVSCFESLTVWSCSYLNVTRSELLIHALCADGRRGGLIVS